VALLLAVLIAYFLVPAPWGWALVGAAAVYEVITTWASWRWSRSRRPVVGAAALVGLTAEVTEACRPDGRVKIGGELWQARCEAGAAAGSSVRVRAVEGIVLVVEPETT
jgi:membrane protein implicated in regulation of membrane protease activity